MSGEKKFKIVKNCINQGTEKNLCPDDIVIYPKDLNTFEMSRHLAEGNMIPLTKKDTTEKAIKRPGETRSKPKQKKRTIVRRKKTLTKQ